MHGGRIQVFWAVSVAWLFVSGFFFLVCLAMSIIDKAHLQTRNGILPDVAKGTVILYRLNAKDEVEGVQKAPNSEIRWPGKRSGPGADKPGDSKNMTFHIWVKDIGTWVVEEYDYVNHSCDWWVVESADLEMADTRWRVICKESKDPR